MAAAAEGIGISIRSWALVRVGGTNVFFIKYFNYDCSGPAGGMSLIWSTGIFPAFLGIIISCKILAFQS